MTTDGSAASDHDIGDSRTERVIRGVLANYTSAAVTAVAGFLLVPIVLRHVGRADYGLWAAVGQAVGYLTLFDLGVGSAVTRRSAELRLSPRAEHAISCTISTAAVVYSALGLLLIGVGVGCSLALPKFLGLSGGRARAASILFVVMAVYVGLSLPLRVAAKALFGLQRLVAANMITLVENLLTPSVTLLLLLAGVGIVALPLGAVVAGIVAAAAAAFALKRAVPGLRVGSRCASVAEARGLFTWSGLLWLNSLAVLVIYQTDNLVAAHGRGLVASATYALTSRLPLYALPVLVALADACLPAAVELCAAGRIESLRRVYLRVLRTTAAAAALVGIIAVAFNKAFVTMWVGAPNYGGLILTGLFAVILYYRVVMQSAAIVVIGTGRLTGVVWMSVAEAVLNLCLSLWWVRPYGLVGIAAATVVSGLLTSAWYVARLVCDALEIRIRSYAWNAFGFPVIIALPAAAVAAGAWWARLATSWPGLATAAAVTVAVWVAMFLSVAVPRHEREEYVAQFPLLGQLAAFAGSKRHRERPVAVLR